MKNLVSIFSVIVLIGMVGCTSSNIDPQKPLEPNIPGIITPQKALELEDYYIEKFYDAANKAVFSGDVGNYGAVRDVWFDLDDLKSYILYVESTAKMQGYKNLGIRVYLGAKDETDIHDRTFPRQTVFFVPTAQNVNEVKGRQSEKRGPSAEDVRNVLSKENIQTENQNIPSINRLNYGNSGLPDNGKSFP